MADVLCLRLGRAQARVSAATASAGPASTTADERGITLQTLIVTAVLVLMAVATGEDLMMRNINNPAVAAQCETSEETSRTSILDIAASPVKDLPGVQLFLDSIKRLVK